jgi:DNA-binding transcriptional LysR family regulator
MELRHLRYFVAVAEELSFRGAAGKLHMAQPPLSAQIKALEAELGVQLLERSTRTVRLTQAGRVFLDEARGVISAAAQAQHRARQADRGIVGTLRVGVIAPVANAWLAVILRRFGQQFPGVQLSISSLTSAEQLLRLRTDELDAGLLRPPVSFHELDCRLVAESHQELAMPRGHRLARKPVLEWKDFHHEGLVLINPSVQHGFYDAFLSQCAQAGAQPYAAQYANDIQTKMWLISAGFGVAPTTATLAEARRPGVVFRPLPEGLPPVQILLAWRRNDSSPTLRRFRESFPEFKVVRS